MKKRKAGKAFWMFLGQIVLFLFFLLTFSLLWGLRNFGNIGFNEIIFTLNMPLKGTSNEFMANYYLTALFPSLLIMAVELLLVVYPFHHNYYFKVLSKKHGIRIKTLPLRIPVPLFAGILGVWFFVLLLAADSNFGIFSYIKSQMVQSALIEEEYANPGELKITFPEKKRNLICIYVESLESSMQNVENGGVFEVNYIPEITEMAKENVSFSQSDLIGGAAVAPASGWTVAGLVAETAGLPLKLFEYNDHKGGADNAMGHYEYFMPGAVSLGDILEKEGYKNYIMFGSNAKFGGRDRYFSQHGNYEIWDYKAAVRDGKISSDYYENWGFEDQKLYEYAKEKILTLANEDEPFHFSMLTADMHTPSGYLCELCPNTYEHKYANVLACSSVQLNEFIDWLKQQSFYENTSVLICGDHCSMVRDFFGEYTYDKHNGEIVRKVFNIFLNSAVSPIKEKNRLFTTMDLFPSVIASLGVEIEGDRLGLGTNLFSEEETMAEKYGYETLFDELNKRSDFYNKEILYP